MPQPDAKAFDRLLLTAIQAAGIDIAVGFTTNSKFDAGYLLETIVAKAAVVLTSLETGGQYNVQPLNQVTENAFTATIRLAHFAAPAQTGHPVTIRPTDNGRIAIVPGWPR